MISFTSGMINITTQVGLRWICIFPSYLVILPDDLESLGIEARHDGATTATHTLIVGGIYPLLEREALLAYGHHGGLHLDLVVEECGHAEITVDVDYDHTYLAPFQLVAEHGLEIAGLGKIHECEVDAVVEVSQHVNIVEPHLQRHVVAEVLDSTLAVIAHCCK